MAVAQTSPPLLRLKRSAQSGAKVMTVVFSVVYQESSTLAYIFAGAEIDLSPMILGDSIDIRIRKQLTPTGAFVVHDQVNYLGPMPATHQTAHIGPIPDVYGIEISMQQTLGALHNIDCEFFDAKRVGLE